MGGFLTSIAPGALGTLAAIGASVAAVLILFIGFCILVTIPKLRQSGPKSMIVRSLDEVSGGPQVYLPATTPRGAIDQLRTPELLQKQSRKSA